MRFAASFLVVSFVVLARAVAPAAPAGGSASVDALLARARAGSGAPYRSHVISRSTEVRDGRTFEVTTETEGLKYRAHSCAGSVCSGFYFDGEHSYAANLNDTALPLSERVDAFQITLRAIATYAFTDPQFRARGGTISERDPVLRAGRSYRRLAVAAPLGASLDAILDPATGLVAGVVSDERKLAFEFRDQRRVANRVTLPFAVFLNGFAVTRYASRAIASDPLGPPAGLVPHIAPGERVAMTRASADAPVVPCTIGGERVACLLDTGNSGLSMSLELAEKLKLEPQATSFDVRGVGAYVTGLVRAPELRVGGATYPAATYVVLHDVRQYGYDVVLGADAFAHARVTLDYGAREVAFAPEGGEGDAAALPLTFENFLPVVDVGLDATTVPLAIDTGDASTIDLSYDYYARHAALFAPTGRENVAGIGGTSEEVTGDVASVRLGRYAFERQRIGATKGLAATASGHVGTGILRHFNVTFDYAARRVELEPRAGDAAVRARAER